MRPMRLKQSQSVPFLSDGFFRRDTGCSGCYPRAPAKALPELFKRRPLGAASNLVHGIVGERQAFYVAALAFSLRWSASGTLRIWIIFATHSTYFHVGLMSKRINPFAFPLFPQKTSARPKPWLDMRLASEIYFQKISNVRYTARAENGFNDTGTAKRHPHPAG